MRSTKYLSGLAFCFLATLVYGQNGISQPPFVTFVYYANEGVTGTTINKLAKLTGAPSKAIIAGTSDTSGIVGVVITPTAITGNAVIQVSGQASCVFDGATVAGDYVQISSGTAGDCHDTGSATFPSTDQVIGRVISTNGGGGTYTVDMTFRSSFAGVSGGSSVFSGSTAVSSAFSATPTFSLANISQTSPVRFEPGAMTANVTAVTFSNKTAGAKFSIAWLQDGTGSRTVTYGASATSACSPAVNPTAGSTTTQEFEVGSDGSTVYGVGCVSTLPELRGAEEAAPGTPAVNTFVCWADSTSHTFSCKFNNNATISNGAIALSCTNQVFSAFAATGIFTCHTIVPADVNTALKTVSCQPGLGDGVNAMAAASYLESTCYNDTGATLTITGIRCFTDNNGSSTLAATNGAGTALLTGAVTCTNAFAAGTQSGTTTIASGDFVKFTFAADGTSKQSNWVVTFTK